MQGSIERSLLRGLLASLRRKTPGARIETSAASIRCASTASQQPAEYAASGVNSSPPDLHNSQPSTSAALTHRPHGVGSVRATELDKFAALADEWWDAGGSFAPLHAMNPVRAGFVRDALCSCFELDRRKVEPLAGLRVLDVGCGGGLLSESLARMGASVTGIDAAREGTGVAAAHASRDPRVAARTAFRAATAEQLAAEGLTFDAVTALEVIEHVADPQGFLHSLASLVKPWGAVCLSTINRTPRAYAFAILGAERVAGLLPVGTHDWDRFLTPEELTIAAEKAGLELEQLAGMSYDLTRSRWRLTEDVCVNYIAYYQRTGLAELKQP